MSFILRHIPLSSFLLVIHVKKRINNHFMSFLTIKIKKQKLIQVISLPKNSLQKHIYGTQISRHSGKKLVSLTLLSVRRLLRGFFSILYTSVVLICPVPSTFISSVYLKPYAPQISIRNSNSFCCNLAKIEILQKVESRVI